MKNLAKILFTAVVYLFIFQSCMKDDLDDCPADNFRIYFKYRSRNTYSSAIDGIDPTQITQLNLYVFDADGVFLKEYVDKNPNLTDKDYYMTLQNMENGEYHFIVWGGSLNDYSFSHELIPGETTLNEVQLKLNRENKNIENQSLSYLFYAGREDKKTTTVMKNQAIADTLSLLPNTYIINTMVSGLGNSLNDGYTVSIEDNNDVLTFRNEIVEGFDNFFYRTNCNITQGQELKGTITMMPLRENRRIPTLRLQNETTNEVLFEENLIGLILLIRTLYGGTVDFSYMHEFDIELIADPQLNFSVKVNGYEVIEVPTDLDQ